MKIGKAIRNFGAVLVMISVPGCMTCGVMQARGELTGVGFFAALGFVGLVIFIAGRMLE